MPKILFVTQYHYLRYTGGAELQCWMLAREFARRGWDVHYVSENDRPDAPQDLDGIRLHNLPESPHWNDGNREQLADVISRVNPDVIYNRVFNLYTYLAVSLAPKHTVTVWASAAAHDGEITTTLGELRKTKSLKQFLALVPRTLSIRTRARKGALRASIQLAQSNEQLERLSRLGFRPVLLRNSVEFDNELERQTHEGKPLVIWAGSIKLWKRPEIFFDLARRCGELNAEFVMAGDLQDELSREPLERAQRELKNFRYAGFVPPGQIGKLFDRAHVFVSTSRAEGFPNTFIQAWLRGIPVLSLTVNPDSLLSRDRLLNGPFLGNVVSTPDELEQRLRELLVDSQLRRTIGARAREFAQKEFDLQANADKLENFIRQKMKSES